MCKITSLSTRFFIESSFKLHHRVARPIIATYKWKCRRKKHKISLWPHSTNVNKGSLRHSALCIWRLIFLLCSFVHDFSPHSKYFFNWYSGGVESNWVHSALRPPIGVLCQPRVIMLMEKLVEWLTGETEVLGENLPQCRFVHHKPHMLAGREPGPPPWEASD
jgi:hypothetical protein